MRRVLVLLLVVALFAAVGCEKKKDVVSEEPLEPKEQPVQEPDEQLEGFGGTVIPYGGDIVLELTVYHSPTIYLTGKTPLRLVAPADPCFEFESKVFELDKPYFPLKIPFTVTKSCISGNKMLAMGMEVHFAYKADEKEKSKAILLEVPLTVQKMRLPRRATRVPFEYFLDINEAIVEEEVK